MTSIKIHCPEAAVLVFFLGLTVAASGVFAAPRVEDKTLGWPGYDLQGNSCRGRSQGFGPYDYNNPEYTPQLNNVEGHHFNSEVEQLKTGVSSVDVVEDLDYTLRAFPNHHRALYALIRYQLVVKRRTNSTIHTTAECYLQRAIAFAPQDAVLPMLFGIYFHRNGMLQQALEQYQKAEALELDTAELHYNMGLVFVDLKRFSEANAHAQTAYRKGYPLPGLKDTLKKLGHWDESRRPESP